MNARHFMRTLAELSFEHCFNPYRNCCPYYDCRDAAQRRYELLLQVLVKAEERGVDAVWIGRDLGHRGGRRTGLALTDDKHLVEHAGRWGIRAKPVTIGAEMSERTAAVMWSVLNKMPQTVFLWNVFPLHPHRPNEPLTNRSMFLLINLIDGKDAVVIISPFSSR